MYRLTLIINGIPLDYAFDNPEARENYLAMAYDEAQRKGLEITHEKQDRPEQKLSR